MQIATKPYNRILLDIDNTITELQFILDTIASVLKHDRVLEGDVLDFRLSNAFNMTPQEDIDFWLKNEPYLIKNSTLAIERTQRILSTYTDKDTVIDIVTMRPKELYDETYEWLVNHGIPFDQLICVGKENQGRSKIDIAYNLGTQAIFEDNPVFFEEIEKREMNDVFDLYVVDYPFNEHIKNAYRLDRRTGLPITG